MLKLWGYVFQSDIRINSFNRNIVCRRLHIIKSCPHTIGKTRLLSASDEGVTTIHEI